MVVGNTELKINERSFKRGTPLQESIFTDKFPISGNIGDIFKSGQKLGDHYTVKTIDFPPRSFYDISKTDHWDPDTFNFFFVWPSSGEARNIKLKNEKHARGLLNPAEKGAWIVIEGDEIRKTPGKEILRLHTKRVFTKCDDNRWYEIGINKGDN